MIRSRGKLSPEVYALLDAEREIPAQPAWVRARVATRARAALAAGPIARAALPPRAALPSRWAASVTLACIASAAGGAAAYGIHVKFLRADGPVATLSAPAAAVTVARRHDAPAIIVPIDEAPPARPHVLPSRRLSPTDAVRAELRLLRPARAAVAREDFAAALPPIAEHARRFKGGRLAEEREALRVKALVGLGRTEEVRRAAASFQTSFPHSVLLPAIGQMSPAGR